MIIKTIIQRSKGKSRSDDTLLTVDFNLRRRRRKKKTALSPQVPQGLVETWHAASHIRLQNFLFFIT